MRTLKPIALAVLVAALVGPAHVADAAGYRSADLTTLVQGLNGSPRYLGRISAGTSAKNNADTTAFSIPAGSLLCIYSSAAVRVLGDTNATEDITTTNGFPVAATTVWCTLLRSDQAYLQAITASGSADVDVWRME